jgi:ribulose-phosphate 3-epimerase
MHKLIYSPSIMCANLLNLERDITLLQRSDIPYLHVDIMDFNFVPNLTIGFDLLNQLERFPMVKDIHLIMVLL